MYVRTYINMHVLIIPIRMYTSIYLGGDLLAAYVEIYNYITCIYETNHDQMPLYT